MSETKEILALADLVLAIWVCPACGRKMQTNRRPNEHKLSAERRCVAYHINDGCPAYAHQPPNAKSSATAGAAGANPEEKR